MNISYISRSVGIALVFNALFMFASVAVSLVYDADPSMSPLLLSGVITLAVGIFPLIFVRKGGDITLKEGFFTIVCAWLLSCIFGALPYVLWGGEFSVINAWFESVSGYTTTGSSILNDIEALPHGLLFWRTATHYIGGLGVVVFIMLIIPPSKNGLSMRLSKVEINALSKENYRFRLSSTIRIILSVYIGITVIQTLLLRMTGINFFDALNHSMSIAATGGFSTKNMSAAAFESPAAEVIMIFFMYVASLHFGLIYSTLQSRSLKIFRNPVIKFYSAGLLVVIIISTVNLLASGVETNFFTALRHSAFMNVSTASSTGFATTQTKLWPMTSLLLLFYFSFQGACSGSTTGGIKADRMCVWFSSLRARFRHQFHTNAVSRPRLGNRILDNDLVAEVNLFIVFFVTIVFVGAVLLSATGMGIEDSISTSIASVGNTGLTFGSGGAFGSYSAFPAMAKFILTIEMFLGRLEIYPFLAFFVINRWK